MQRTWWLVLAMLVVGCDDGVDDSEGVCGDGRIDIWEECEGESSTCVSCTWTRTALTAHWSFETLSGDAKSPCLPGDPEIRVTVTVPFSNGDSQAVPCASGQALLRVEDSGLWFVAVQSVAGHPYQNPLLTVRRPDLPTPGHLPTVVLYTDAGYVTVGWDIYDDHESCEAAGISKVRVIVDGDVVQEAICYSGSGHTQSTTIGPILDGTRSIRLEGLDSSNDVIAMAAPIDVKVVAGTTVIANARLQPK